MVVNEERLGQGILSVQEVDLPAERVRGHDLRTLLGKQSM